MKKIQMILMAILGALLLFNDQPMYHAMGLVFFWGSLMLLIIGEILGLYND